MLTIISGTNRHEAVTRLVADHYAAIAQELGVTCQILDLRDLPATFASPALYDSSSSHPELVEMQEIVDSSSSFAIICPEYNGSFPGVLKTFIDGLSYPNTMKGKPCGLVGFGSGNMGGSLALSHLTDIMHYLGVWVLPLKPRLPFVEKHLEDTAITNQFFLKMLREQVEVLGKTIKSQ